MYRYAVKRLIDFVLSLIGLLVLLPLFVILMIWIKLDSPGPVFFRQRRVGIHKTEFDILKFRTMYTDTPKDMPTHLLADPERFITKAGRFLRKTSLDELPQLINILKGDMSIVGPRPALYNQEDLIAERDKYGANDILPGLTGWAQINGRDELAIADKAALDGYYTEHISFPMDLKCFFGTFGAVFTQKGIHEGAKRERKKILLITNHSYMLYRFRLDLIKKLMEEHEVVLSMPFVGHEDDFQAMGLKCINTELDRRGINPIKDYALYRNYRRQLKEEAPDLVITYSIKPNIYAGYLAGRMNIPYVAMVQGLGTAFKKPVLASLVTVMYRTALRRAYRVLFENEDNARLFAEKGIVDPRKEVILNGAGINLTYFDYMEYPDNDIFRFLYVGRFMNEKGCGELFEAVRRLHSEKVPFVLDLAGFHEDDFKEQVESLKTLGIVNDHGFV
ncbi:MAG: sugar transferase, partial [Solobacterium sp.]|nr:sugar transferase [Solobacterium sp.]